MLRSSVSLCLSLKILFPVFASLPNPVDVLIAPDVAHISMIDFHRGAEAIEAGRRATLAVKEKIMQAANLAKNAAARGEPAR